MSDANLNSLDAAIRHQHKHRFTFALGNLSNTPIVVEDLEFASECSRDELFTLAAALHAKARISAAPPENGGQR